MSAFVFKRYIATQQKEKKTDRKLCQNKHIEMYPLSLFNPCALCLSALSKTNAFLWNYLLIPAFFLAQTHIFPL